MHRLTELPPSTTSSTSISQWKSWLVQRLGVWFSRANADTANQPRQKKQQQPIWTTYLFIHGPEHWANDALQEKGHCVPLYKWRGKDGAVAFAGFSCKEEFKKNTRTITTVRPSLAPDLLSYIKGLSGTILKINK